MNGGKAQLHDATREEAMRRGLLAAPVPANESASAGFEGIVVRLPDRCRARSRRGQQRAGLLQQHGRRPYLPAAGSRARAASVALA